MINFGTRNHGVRIQARFRNQEAGRDPTISREKSGKRYILICLRFFTPSKSEDAKKSPAEVKPS